MSEKLHIRVLEKEDLHFVHRLFNDESVTNYWFEEPYLSFEQLKKEYDEQLHTNQLRRFILEDEAGERVGFVALYKIDHQHRHAEFAIIISPDYQGKGYASIATDLAISYSFSILNLHKLYLLVAKKNEKAIHIYEKAGFKEEGLLKEHFFVDGQYEDCLIMSLFQNDFIK